MSTQFYLADSRFMNPQEMELAETYDDSAFICSQHAGRTEEDGKHKSHYSLGIPTIVLYNLPKDTRIVNNNNSEICTIGELIDSIKDGLVESMDERLRKNEEGIRDWLLSKPDIGGWEVFRWAKKMVEKDSEAVPFPEKPGAMQYINRNLASLL